MPRAFGLAVAGLMMVQVAGCDSREEQLVDVHSERAEAGEAEEERAKDIAKEREKEPANHNPLATPEPPTKPAPAAAEQTHGGLGGNADAKVPTQGEPKGTAGTPTQPQR